MKEGIYICGIWGFQAKPNVVSTGRRASIYTMLALGNERRGDDSWGFYDSMGTKVIKGLGAMSASVHEFVDFEAGFGHTRRGTTGAITVPNAHPFEIGNIIGAHNGIIFNHEELNSKYNRDHQVDSMHIFSHLNEGKGLEELRGYGAIQWIEKDSPKDIYVCKVSSEGELSIAAIENESGKTVGVVWSSDGNHLKAALKVAGVRYTEFKVETGVVYLAQGGNLYKTERKLGFADRFTSEIGRDWRQGMISSDNSVSSYESWLSNRRGQTQLSNEGDKSDSGSLFEEESLWHELHAAKNWEKEEEEVIESAVESFSNQDTRSLVVVNDNAISIPPVLKDSDVDFKTMVQTGRSEFSFLIGDWVSFDKKRGQFFVGNKTRNYL